MTYCIVEDSLELVLLLPPLLGAGITGMCHHVQLRQRQGSSPGLHAHYTSTGPTEHHSQPKKRDLLSLIAITRKCTRFQPTRCPGILLNLLFLVGTCLP